MPLKSDRLLKGIFICGMLFSTSASALYAPSDDKSAPVDAVTAVATATTQSVPAGQPTSELATAPLDEATAVPQAVAAPQMLEEVALMPRVVVAEEVEALIREADNSEITDEQKTIMIDTMSKVHEVVAELHIKLLQRTARWISPENTTQNEADQKAARALFETDLKEAMTAEEATAESRRIQALYVEARASNNERMINFIGDMPTAMKCLFKKGGWRLLTLLAMGNAQSF